MSLRMLSEAMGGIALSHLSEIEMGRRFPTLEQLEKFSTALNIPLDSLAGLDPREPIREVSDFIKREPQFAFAFRKFVKKVRTEGLSASQVDNFLNNDSETPPTPKDTPP